MIKNSVILLVIAITGCGGGGGGGGGGTTDTSFNDPAGVQNPTYHEHIASILNDNCVTCHQTNGIAPFPLDTYADAISVPASSIHLDTKNRTMPPYLADNSGQCNTFTDARWLNDDDIGTIANWVAAGKPEGTAPATPLPPPTQLALDPTEVGATAAMDALYAPTGSPPDNPNDDYQCFVIDPGITTDKFLTAYEVKPGNTELVHHIILYALKTDAAEAEATRLTDSDTTDLGYSCFGGSGIFNDNPTDVGFLAGWAPGINLTRFPATTGIPIAANRKMVMQVHYNLDGGRTGTDQTEIDLALADTVGQEATVSPIADLDMVLPANEQNTSTNVTAPAALIVNGQGFQIHGVFPHMHTLGRQIRVDRVNTVGSDCIVNVPRWDFEWQQFFFFSSDIGPMIVNATDQLSLTCSYDTRGRTSDVIWGDGTQDEMCVNFFYTTPLP